MLQDKTYATAMTKINGLGMGNVTQSVAIQTKNDKPNGVVYVKDVSPHQTLVYIFRGCQIVYVRFFDVNVRKKIVNCSCKIFLYSVREVYKNIVHVHILAPLCTCR